MNKEKRKASHDRYKQKNPEKVKRWNREWIENHREQYNASKWILAHKIKVDIFKHYGKGIIKCNGCGITDLDILTLDHINNDGNAHRREITGKNHGAAGIYRQLRKLGYPEGLQILCFNCNWKKEMNLRNSKRMLNNKYVDYINEYFKQF